MIYRVFSLLLPLGAFAAVSPCWSDDFLDYLESSNPVKFAKAVEMIEANPALANHKDTRYVSSRGRFALNYLAQWNNVPAIELLLRHGADLNIRDPLGRTPLHFAALSGSKEAFETLKAAGADTKAVDNSGLDYVELQRVHDIHWVIWQDDVKTLRTLLRKYPHLIYEPDVSGDPPLVNAASLEKLDVVKEILRHKPNVNAQNSFFHWTALHCAAQSKDVEMVELLLAQDADVGLFDWEGNSALHHVAGGWSGFVDPAKRKAVTPGLKKMVDLLLKHGADPLAMNADGKTPLHLGQGRGTKLDDYPEPEFEPIRPEDLPVVDPFH